MHRHANLLLLASEEKEDKYRSRRQNCSSIIAEMVRNKANLNVRSSLGTTPLSLACHAKHTEAVEVLLRAKASADPIDDYGKKAPLYAILPPWDETLVDNADENLTVKTVQLLARARTNLDDGGDNSPIVESVSPTQEEVLVDPGIAWLKIELNPCEVPRSKKTEREGLAPQKKAFYDASQLELLEDLDLQDVDKKHKVVFQQLVSQILTINRSFTTGIRRSDLKEWHEMSKFRPATSEDHQHFVGQVLSNAQLMAQSSRAMRAVHESLLTGAEELNEKPLDRVQLLSFLAKAVHDMKLCTAHLCWHDFVKPLRERKDELELGFDRLRVSGAKFVLPATLTAIRLYYFKFRPPAATDATADDAGDLLEGLWDSLLSRVAFWANFSLTLKCRHSETMLGLAGIPWTALPPLY
ncbi:unnamed protein product [Symbiodinium sp. KB8]|nr:unnamed protein product [Symbiodinium sp. KB8]